MKALLLSTCAILALCGSAHAETAAPQADAAGAEAANAVQGVVVTATRSAQSADRIGQQLTVLDREAIRSSQALVVSDLLSRTPGVSFSRNGGVGGVTTVRIRGAEGDQTVVVVDGVKLNDPSQVGGGYNFADLLTGDIARIEILRGAQSTLWGSQAIGGVVNIVTETPTKPFVGKFEIEGGAMDTGSAKAAVGGASETVTWRIAASRPTTSSVSSYRLGSEADGYRNTGLSGRANIRLAEDVSFELRTVYSKGRNAFDGFPAPLYSFADTPEYGESQDLVAYAGVNFGLLGGGLQNRVAYGYTRTDRDSFNPAQAATEVTFSGRGQNKRYEYQGVLDIAPGWNAVFGAEHEASSMHIAAPSEFDPNPPVLRGDAEIASVYGQVLATVATGLTLTGGLRHDSHDTFGEKTLGQAAAAWSLNDGSTVLRASFGQGFKAPTLYQLYSEYGNLTLRPEDADGWDAGVEHRMLDGAVKVSATYFGRETTNQIDFVSCPSATTAAGFPLCYRGGVRRFGYYDNIARTKAKGFELAGSAQAGPIGLEANHTWTVARNDVAGSANFGRFLARRPEHAANVTATAGIGPVEAALAWRYVGEAFDNASNSRRLAAYGLFDVRLSYPISDRVEVHGRIENLTDEDYETTGDYGSPGRAAYIGLRASF